MVLNGRYLNLFEPDLEGRNTVMVGPQERMPLFDLKTVKPGDPRVVAAVCRVRNEVSDGKTLRFDADGIGTTNAVVAIAARKAPAAVTIGGQPLDPARYDYTAGVLRLHFPNAVDPVKIEVRLAK